VIEELDPSYLSDLKPEDIPDDAVSDVEQSAGMGELEADQAEETKGNLIAELANQDKRAEEENMKFMRDFVTLYASDASAAKASYYKIKVDLDIGSAEG
jgi:hypothetical protein